MGIRHCLTGRGFLPDEPNVSSKEFIQNGLEDKGFTLAGYAMYCVAVP